MNRIFTSNNFVKELEVVVGKNIDTMNKGDLSNVRRLTLVKKNFDGTMKDYCINDLTVFENLKAITFSMFTFTEDDIEKLNSIYNLNFIQFDFCKFDVNTLQLNAENLVFNVCKTLKIDMLKNSNAKNMKIIGSELDVSVIDIHNFGMLENLEELSLHHFRIKNMGDLKNIAPKLKSLNIDGSQIDSEEEIKSMKMKVSHKERFFRANA